MRETEPSDALLKGARVEGVELLDNADSFNAASVVIRFSTGATLYADAPTLYLPHDDSDPED